MKSLKITGVIIIILGLFFYETKPVFTYAAEKTNSQLQKEIKSLKTSLKKKDEVIKSQNKIIAGYKNKYHLSLSSTKLMFNGSTSKTNYTYNNQKFPSVLSYNNVLYAPVQLVANLMDTSYSYDFTKKIVYLGPKPDGLYMSDILKPYYVSEMSNVYLNSIMNTGNITYQKGYKLSFFSNSQFSFNLKGKYNTISGLIGIENQTRSSNVTKVDFLGDNQVLGTYNIVASDLPVNFQINVKNIKKLDIVISTDTLVGISYLDFANVLIK